MDIGELAETVKTKEDFIFFLRELQRDFPYTPSWSLFAKILLTASIYE
jgi:hypothetical protein